MTCRACAPAAKSLRKRLAKGLQTSRSLSQVVATPSTRPSAPPDTQSQSRVQLIRLLKELSALLESATGKSRQIAFSAHDGGIEEEQEWRTRLQHALEDLQAAKARKTKVISQSGPTRSQSVVTGLMECDRSPVRLVSTSCRHLACIAGRPSEF
jgi:transposase